MRSIVQSIGDRFDQATEDAERERAKIEHPNDLDKRDLLFAANYAALWQPTRENYLARIALVDRALALDPNFGWALRKAGWLHAQLVIDGFSSDPATDLSIAIEATNRALLHAPNDLHVLRTKVTVLRAWNDWKGAETLFRKIIELQPMNGYLYMELAQVLMKQGRHEEALGILMVAQGLLAPTDDGRYLHLRMATALVLNDRCVEAMAPARLAMSEFPPDSGAEAEQAWLALIAAEAENGQDTEARADLAKFLAAPRHFRNIGQVRNTYYLALNQNLIDGLRQAGMPAD